MPTYTIFAGVNGAGKTSIYQSIYYQENKNEKRINTDEMIARIGSWKDNTIPNWKNFYCKQKARLLGLAFCISYAVSFTISGSSTI